MSKQFETSAPTASVAPPQQAFEPVAVIGLGYVGIRTDFMDVEFDNFRAEKI